MSDRLKAHPYADEFPLMNPEDQAALAEDIKANGLRFPGVLFEGKILDGRNRYAACLAAGVKPRFETFEGTDDEAWAFVVSANIKRRQMTAGQRAITSARRWFAVNGGARPKSSRHAAENTPIGYKEIAKQCNSSDKYVLQAADLLEEASDLAQQVWDGLLTLGRAHDQLVERRKEATKKARDAARITAYRSAVEDGEMTVDEALLKAMEDERREAAKQESIRLAVTQWWDKLIDLKRWLLGQADISDEHLASYEDPETPGRNEVDHDLTQEDIDEAIAQMQRIREQTLRGRHGPKKKKRH